MAPAQEISPPDISPYAKGNTGCDYTHRFESGVPGPRVFISAIIHGNEICGAIALDYLLRHDIRPAKGCLTLCFANVAAYDTYDPAHPHTARFVDEDMNRLWSPHMLSGSRKSSEMNRARALLPLIRETDSLLDLHSMSEDCPALTLAGRRSKNLELALMLGQSPFVVRDDGHVAGKRLRDYEPFDHPESEKTALLVECGAHWKSKTADFAIQTALAFLDMHGMLSEEDAARLNFQPATGIPKVLDVTHTITTEGENFFFTRPVHSLECVPKAGTEIGVNGDHTVTTPYDNCYVIMPQPGALKGRTAARLARLVDQ